MPQDSGNTTPFNKDDKDDRDDSRQLAQSEQEADFVAAVQLSASRILKDLHVEEERTGEIISEIEKDSFYRDFKNSWEDLTPEERAHRWPEQLKRIVKTVYACRPYCMRCGECCSQVSPSLHQEDVYLFDEGILRYSDTYTIRKGEPVLDNINSRLETLSQELIKIKESSKNRLCLFYEKTGKSCRIYEKRPIQCRTQECWNPEALEHLWSRDKLTRRHLIKADNDLAELIEIHDQRCSPQLLDKTVKNYWGTGKTSDLDPVVEILSQDMIIRNFFLEKMGRDQEELEFLIGRPLAKVVEAYNLEVEKDTDGTYHLIQIS